MAEFKIKSEYKPAGDQPKAIDALVKGIEQGQKEQTLLGVTGSGKTFTMANIIERVQKPTLVLAHNKTLAAQLCSEFREFFPDNAVEYFVSYYDYYQPEAYIASTDTYIEKDSKVNDEIDRLRHSATAALFERKDVIIVASVSCIYSLGDPVDYENLVLSIRSGMEYTREKLLRKLTDIQYERNDIAFDRNRFRVRGDTIEIHPANTDDYAIRIELEFDEIYKITEFDLITGASRRTLNHAVIFPASHYVTTADKIKSAVKEVKKELAIREEFFIDQEKLVEAQRITQRTNYDMEMLQEIGFCSGIENYSRVLSGRKVGSTPFTLIDYFPKDFMLFVDESHVMLPQVRGMYFGDRARKESLVENGFRLPSAFDNRPLNFAEFENKMPTTVYVSATPASYEKENSTQIVEQLIRPTGLLDPEIFVRPIENQIDDLLEEIHTRIEKKERTLITTLTKKMAEDLTNYLREAGVKVSYMHHDVKTIERMQIIRDLRLGVYDVLIGINLLREGLDIPEVTLICILDADKEGFLRSETSLVQTIGRAARNENGKVIMYADKITPSMDRAIKETNRRREIQMAHNEKHGITPKTVKKEVRDIIEISMDNKLPSSNAKKKMDKNAKERMITELTRQMKEAASMLEFELAGKIRDQIKSLNE
ncbi:MAG: excinuclease ABC subunit UvrB [Clostridia bacterium]